MLDNLLTQAEGFKHRIADARLAAQRRARKRRDGAAGGLAGHAARRRPRHVSLCHVVESDRWRCCRRFRHRPDPHHHGAGHPQGVHHARGLRPVPHRVVRRDRRVPVQDGRRVRGDDRPAPPLRLVRRGDRPLRHPGQRHHRLLPDQARRAVQPGDGAGLRRLHGRRQAHRRDADDAERHRPRGADLRGAARLVGGHLRAPASSTTCPPRRATTCCGWKSLPEPMFRASASGPAGSRPSCAATSWPR